MSLPVARPPEPKHTGAVFHDPVRHTRGTAVVITVLLLLITHGLCVVRYSEQEGQAVLPEDSLVFIQFPTTLPLANAVATLPKGKEDVEMTDANESAAPVSAEEARRSKLAVKEEKAVPPSQPHDIKSDDPADETSAKNLCVHCVARVVAREADALCGD